MTLRELFSLKMGRKPTRRELNNLRSRIRHFKQQPCLRDAYSSCGQSLAAFAALDEFKQLDEEKSISTARKTEQPQLIDIAHRNWGEYDQLSTPRNRHLRAR